MAPPLRLRCAVQNYDWGKIGPEARVSKLYALNSRSEIDSATPYAELWAGTHPSGSCYILPFPPGGPDCPTSLMSWISHHPEALGDRVHRNWGADLPFLFKVLSVAKALSIQAHPDKELARVLHKMQPSIYKDSNHKPEMAVAITEFEALCGFLSLEELKGVLNTVPEIVELVGFGEADQILNLKENDDEEKVKASLRSIFSQLMSASKDAVSSSVSRLIVRLNIENKVRELTEKEQLALRLEKQYSTDIGVISSFLLNYVELKPGEALCLGANEPHAYLAGDCIECMATSDNVVRAGLTPKFRDVQTLCSMLTYKQGYPEILRGTHLNPYVRRYLPPFDEFEVDSCGLPSGVSVDFPAVLGPSIFIVMAGGGFMRTDSTNEDIREGDVFFVPAETKVSMTAATLAGTDTLAEALQLYRAGVNSKWLETQNL